MGFGRTSLRCSDVDHTCKVLFGAAGTFSTSDIYWKEEVCHASMSYSVTKVTENQTSKQDCAADAKSITNSRPSVSQSYCRTIGKKKSRKYRSRDLTTSTSIRYLLISPIRSVREFRMVF